MGAPETQALPAIKKALVKKANGRVLQTDSRVPAEPTGDVAGNFQAFLDRVKETPLYFDLMISR
jgi:hypothetical protein